MRFLSVLFLGLFFVGCAYSKEKDYRLSPWELRGVLEECAQKSLDEQTCSKAYEAAQEVQKLVNQCIASQQDFGVSILDLQVKIAKERAQYSAAQDKKVLNAQIHQDEYELAKRLAVVRFIESPENRP